MADRSPHPDISYRFAAAEDAPAVADLHADSWRRHYRGAYSDAFLDGDVRSYQLTTWKNRLNTRDGTTATILAEQGADLIGFVHVVFDDDHEWGSLIDNLHVAYTCKRAGIGSRLMSNAARVILEHGPGGLYLWVLEQNADAQAFYTARGGEISERRPVPPPGGVPGRLNGAPYGLRYVWLEPHCLI